MAETVPTNELRIIAGESPVVSFGHISKQDFQAMYAYRADAQALKRQPDISYVLTTEQGINAEEMASSIRAATGYPVEFPLRGFRFSSADGLSRNGLVVLHNATQADVELSAWMFGIVVSAPIVRALGRVIFNGYQFQRATFRIKPRDEHLRDYARRLGFRPEGKLHQWFADGEDAFVWGMTKDDFHKKWGS